MTHLIRISRPVLRSNLNALGRQWNFQDIRVENYCGIEDEIVIGIPKLKTTFLQFLQ